MENLSELIEEIDAKGDGLTSWEANFIGDMLAKPEPRRFTEKQAAIIRRLYDEKVH